MPRLLAVALPVLLTACASEPASAPADLSGADDDLAGADLGVPADLATSPWHAIAAPVDGGEPLRGVWAAPSEAWAVGGSSLILRFAGESGARDEAYRMVSLAMARRT